MTDNDLTCGKARRGRNNRRGRQCKQKVSKVGSSSPESSAAAAAVAVAVAAVSTAAGGLLVPAAALAVVGFDIVEARDESLGPESSRTMAGVSYLGRWKWPREARRRRLRNCFVLGCRIAMQEAGCGRGVGSLTEMVVTRTLGRATAQAHRHTQAQRASA